MQHFLKYLTCMQHLIVGKVVLESHLLLEATRLVLVNSHGKQCSVLLGWDNIVEEFSFQRDVC